jgi:hypothetical protein
MVKKFTQNDVILYLYNELATDLIKPLEEALSQDAELLQFYYHSLDAMKALDELVVEPNATIVSILNEEAANHNSLEIH